MRRLMAFASWLTVVVALEATMAFGETDVSRITVQEPEFTDDWMVMLRIDADDGGELEWYCLRDALSEFSFRVNEARRAERQKASQLENIRVRVDSRPMWSETVLTFDVSADDYGLPPFTQTGELLPTGGFVDDLVAGQRLIAQVGGLRTLSFNLSTARSDIVEFKSLCERVYVDPWVGGEVPRSAIEYYELQSKEGEGAASELQQQAKPEPPAAPSFDTVPGCRRTCEFHAFSVEHCNAGRQPEDSVTQSILDGMGAEFLEDCLETCGRAPGNRNFFNVSLETDISVPNRCAYRWTWCTPDEDWTSCTPPPTWEFRDSRDTQ